MSSTSGPPDPTAARRVCAYARTSSPAVAPRSAPICRSNTDPGDPQGASSIPGLALERQDIIRQCIGSVSVAEISAHLHLPLGVVRVLVGDMAEEGYSPLHRPHAGPATAQT